MQRGPLSCARSDHSSTAAAMDPADGVMGGNLFGRPVVERCACLWVCKRASESLCTLANLCTCRSLYATPHGSSQDTLSRVPLRFTHISFIHPTFSPSCWRPKGGNKLDFGTLCGLWSLLGGWLDFFGAPGFLQIKAPLRFQKATDTTMPPPHPSGT